MRRPGIAIIAAVFLVIGFFAGRFSEHGRAPVGIPASQNFSESTSSDVKEQVLGKSVKVARVIDGDTIELQGGERVRYIGMDTPETVDPRKPVQCFGVEASKRNKELVEGKTVRLLKDVSDRDKYGRLLRYVWVDNEFVNLELVNDGYAQVSTFPPDVKYSTEFLKAERDAREAKRGLWSACPGTESHGDLVPVGTQQTSLTSNGCVIKGNIGSDGSKIYHLLNCPYYEKTKIDESRGERWFCSESEATASGWRKAMNCP